jgi:D-aminopeptidase
VPRVTDLGITIGLLPSGPAGSVLDVPGVGLGHATVWRDEPAPPAGRGVARTGVTVIDPGGDLFLSPVPVGGAVLNGAGECTGLLAVQEWGLAETPVFLTSTMQVGRVYDAACELLMAEQPAIGTDDVIIPICAECDDSFLSDPRCMQVDRDDVRVALAAATGLRAPRGAAPPGAPVTGSALDGYFDAVVEATEEAVINSLLQSVTVTGRDGNTSRQIPAEALRRLVAGYPGSGPLWI